MKRVIAAIKIFGWQYREEIIGILIILFLHLKFTYNISSIIDVDFADESAILGRGLNLSFLNIPSDGWVYYLWYKLLSFFTKDNLSIYCVNFAILIGLPAYFLFLIMKKLKHNNFAAMGAAVIFMVARMNVDAWPFITKFALIMFLMTIYCSLFIKGLEENLVVYMTGSMLLAYTRPEYTISFFIISILLFALLIYRCLKKEINKVGHLKTILVIYLFNILIFYLIGNPMAGQRSIMAFGQHFSLNYVAWNNLQINPWTNWESIVEKVFGTNNSILQAMLNNPSALFRHVSTNIHNLISSFLLYFLPYNLQSDYITKIAKALERIVFVAMIIIIVRELFKYFKIKKIDIRSDIFKTACFGLIVALPAGISLIIIYPRTHYILIPATIIFFIGIHIVAKYLPSLQFLNKTQKNIITIITICFLCYGMPFKTSGMPDKPILKTSNSMSQINIKRIKMLESLNMREKVVILSPFGSICTYLSDNYSNVELFKKDTKFIKFINENTINMIIVNDELIKDTRFTNDSEFELFIEDFENRGFYKVDMKIPGHEEYLLIEKDLK